jgi:chaperonin GroES
MATAAVLPDEEQHVPTSLDTLTLDEILTPNVNLADFLSDNVLSGIGQKVVRDVAIDEKSRENWLCRYQKWLDMAMQVREAKNFPWPKASNVKFPLLTVAAVQFQARAYPAIVDGSNLVKGRVLGPDPDGEKRKRADRIGAHMTWQLLYRMPGWEEETDRLLLQLPICGCVFRKSYYDSVASSNCSEMVSGEDFIINYWAKSLESAPRYTHRLRFYPHEVSEKVSAGLWREVPVQAEAESADDEDALVEFYEQHRYLDLDDDGYPEPFIVTTTKDGQVARIVPCFGADNVKISVDGKVDKLSDHPQFAAAQQANDLGSLGKIVCIDRRQYFTKYAFIPAPDGSFYDIGFGWLLEDISEPINTAINQMLDAASLQNAGGGFLGSGINIRGGSMTFRIGEWKRVEVVNNAPLKDNVFRLDHPGPSAVLFSLLGMMIQSAKEITSVQDVMTGEGTTNQPATTTLALIEQGHKVMTGIFKRIHRAFGRELRTLFGLNRDYLDEEEYFLLNDGDQAQQIAREDYDDSDLDVVPVSDPSLVTDMQKMARSEAEWGSFLNDPLINQVELRKRRMEVLGTPDPDTMLKVPAPAPDPKMLVEAMKEARGKIETLARVRQLDAASALSAMQAAQAAYDMGDLVGAANLMQAALNLGGTVDDDTGAGGVPAMEGQPPDAGVPEPAGQAPVGPDSGMGPGSDALPGGAGPGGDLGPVGGGQL